MSASQPPYGSLAARVDALHPLCDGIIGVDLVPAHDAAWPMPTPGAHVDLHLPTGAVRQYSLYAWNSAEGTTACQRYRIAVQRELAGRGGSDWLHQRLCIGDVLPMSPPRNSFPLVAAARYVLIAGGIGITPILPMAFAISRQSIPFTLHYLTRTSARSAFAALLQDASFANHVTLFHDEGDPARSLALANVIKRYQGDARLYCCGPARLMQAVRQTAAGLGWPDQHCHFESFGPAEIAGQTPFAVRIASTGETLTVPGDQTLLQVLCSAGYMVDSSCEQGLCGTCQIGVLEGQPDHRDEVLSEAERAAGAVMMACVSRARSPELVLDL